jgi:voltage-gated potassium channel Kch
MSNFGAWDRFVVATLYAVGVLVILTLHIDPERRRVGRGFDWLAMTAFWVIGFWIFAFAALPFFVVAHPNFMIAVFGLLLLLLTAVFVRVIRGLSDGKRILLLGLTLVAVIVEYAYLYSIDGICSDTDCLRVENDWATTLYFSIVTFTTTGYGDFHPQKADRLVAASEALAGYLFFGLFVSLLSSYFVKNDRH